MKFFVSNDLKKERSLQIMITALLVLITLFLISNLFVKGSSFGFDAHTTFITLIGDEENFIEPYSFDALLEMVHIDLFLFSMIFLIVAGLGLRIAKHSVFLKSILLTTLISLIIASISPFIALQGFYIAAILWYYSFIYAHLAFIIAIIFTLKVLWDSDD